MAGDWEKTAKDKADSVLALIPKEWRIDVPSIEEQKDVTGPYIRQFLTKEEIAITESDAVDIVAHTSSGQWKCVDVARAFCHRAALAHQLVNCLHEIFFEQALATAEELDRYYAKHKKPFGLLHGLPISLKDQFHVRDVETSMGYVGWIGTFEGKKGTGKEKNFESEMVRELRSLGAVLFVKTAVPHTLMAAETVNNIIKYTRNPKNRNLSSGGSSGGEGALMSLRGSPVGFGTDIGGSIRIPAAFNGLYGIRPSSGRLPYHGMANSLDGQNSILSVVGPIATSPDALKLVIQAVLTTQPWLHDPLCHEIPWREEADLAVSDPIQRFKRQLSFGVVRHDGHAAPHPPVLRAIETVAKAMETLGHRTIDWDPKPTTDHLNQIVFECYLMDGGHDCNDAMDLSGEPMAPQSLIPPRFTQKIATEIHDINVRKRQAQKAFMDYWNSTAAHSGTGHPVDAIIAPIAPFAASRENGFTYVGYSTWVNLVDYTSVIIPVTQVDQTVDKKYSDFKAVDEVDERTQNTYDAELFDGAHVSIQLVGRRLQEEKMLALAKYIGEALHGKARAL